MDSYAWLPKPEAALSAFVANELRHRLHGRALVVNREVLVHQTDEYGAGDRTDILIESPGVQASSLEPLRERVAVVVEIKGSWHEEVHRAQRQQLIDRYLPQADTDHGIYLVGWYPLDLWTDQDDYRRRRAASRNCDELEAALVEQSHRISEELQMTTHPVVLEVPRSRSTAQDGGPPGQSDDDTDAVP